MLAEVFSVPTSQFIKYELTVWLPWLIKRYVLFKKIPKPPPIIGKAETTLPGELPDEKVVELRPPPYGV